MISSDIKFYHSGSGNCSPSQDKGGVISTCEITNTALNNLFDSVSPKISRQGYIDYRCIYVKNASGEYLRNTKIYIGSERKGGSFIDLGVTVANEVQTINFFGTTPNEGNFVELYVPNYGFATVYFHPNKTIFLGNLLTALQNINGLNGLQGSVSGEVSGASINITFTVVFTGQAQSHNMTEMSVNFTDITGCSITIATVTNGTPVNVVACTIAKVTVPPPCVSFSYPARGNPIYVGTLANNDYVPIWVRRTIPSGTLHNAVDQFILNVDGVFP